MFEPSLRLKSHLSAGKPARVGVLGPLLSPKLVELVGSSGQFDALWLDQEHGGISQSEIEVAAIAARAVGIDTFVRLPWTNYAALMRPLEAGCSGVLISMIRTVEEVREVIAAAKFHPIGRRGLFGMSRDGNYGRVPVAEYLNQANDQTWVGIQVETVEALEAVEEIAAIEGVDHIFVGPADLSQAMGIPGEVNAPGIQAAFERVSLACKSQNRSWGTLVSDPAKIRALVGLGCQLFATSVDVHLVHAGLRAIGQIHDEAGLGPGIAPNA